MEALDVFVCGQGPEGPAGNRGLQGIEGPMVSLFVNILHFNLEEYIYTVPYKLT